METIKRKNGSIGYRESFYFNGKKIQSPVFDKKTDAKAWKARNESEKQLKLSRGEDFFIPSEISFREYADKWLETVIKVECSKKTYISYSSICKTHLNENFGDLKLSKIKEENARDFLQKLKIKHNAKGISNIWSVFRAIIFKAKREKLIFQNPLENIVLPKSDLMLNKFWNIEEISTFLRLNRDDDLYFFYLVALNTGMRLSELCGLCWDRIDFNLNQILVSRTRDKYGTKDTTKTKLKRIIPMTSEVRSTLQSLSQKGSSSSFVFLESNGEPVKYAHIYRRFGNAQNKANMANKIRFHDLRHTFASNFMMSNGNLFDLQKILGHTKIDMTMRYAHFSPEHLQNSTKFMSITSELKMDRPDLDHPF